MHTTARNAGYDKTYTYLVDPDGAPDGKKRNVDYFPLHCEMPDDQPIGIAIVGTGIGVGPVSILRMNLSKGKGKRA